MVKTTTNATMLTGSPRLKRMSDHEAFADTTSYAKSWAACGISITVDDRMPTDTVAIVSFDRRGKLLDAVTVTS